MKTRQCRAKTRSGARCKRRATRKDRACEIRAHQEQVAGRGTVGRREPAKHKAQCKACRHPELARVEAEWTIGALADVAAANTLRCSERSWQRHAAYKGLYLERANRGLLPFLFDVMESALSGKPTLAAGVTAAALAHKIIQGGERFIIEAIERAKPELFDALNAARKLPEDTPLEGLIDFLLQRLGGGADASEQVH